MTIASHIEDAEPRGFLGTWRRDNDRAFRRAIRHSRFVRFARVAIPILVVVGSAATYVSYRWLGSLQAIASLPVSAEATVLSGTKITMQRPLVNGYTRDKQPYSVTARTAAQDVTKPDTIELEEILATLSTDDKGKVQLTALAGFYDGKAEKLTLQRDVVVKSPEFEATLREAVLYVRKGDVVSEQPIEIKMLQGTLSANRLEINQSGAVILFDGGVTLVIDRQAAEGPVTGAVR